MFKAKKGEIIPTKLALDVLDEKARLCATLGDEDASQFIRDAMREIETKANKLTAKIEFGGNE